MKRALLVPLMLALATLACSVGGAAGDEEAATAIDAFLAGDYTTTIDQMQIALEEGLSEVSEEEAYTIMGNAYLELGQPAEAEAVLRQAIEANPDYAQAWVSLGIAYRNQDDFDGAEDAYSTALELDPDDPEALSSLGVLYIARGDDIEEAINLLERATQLDPEYATSHANLAVAYAYDGRYNDARESLALASDLGYPSTDQLADLINTLEGEE